MHEPSNHHSRDQRAQGEECWEKASGRSRTDIKSTVLHHLGN